MRLRIGSRRSKRSVRCLRAFWIINAHSSFRDAPLGAGPESILPAVVVDSGLARGACHRAGQRPDPLARAPGMTKADLNIQFLVASKNAVLVEGDAAVAGEIGLDVRSVGDAIVQIDQAGDPAFERFH